ncbi:MAG: hypothetical protein M3H12_03105 [Chromatiales bacterium]
MESFIAERELLYSLKGESTRKRLLIRVGAPYLVDKKAVNFNVSPGTTACEIEFEGLPRKFTEEASYGVDSIQALALATDLDSCLKRLNKKYDLFWPCGDPYFDG